MTTKYVGPQAVEATYRECLARLEVQRLQAHIAETTASAALVIAGAELAALEAQFLAWQETQKGETS